MKTNGKRRMVYSEPSDEWLAYGHDIVRQLGFRFRGYNELIEKLHNTPFRYFIERDESRAKDGLYLRRQMLGPDAFQDRDCSVLEMLAAFAKRMFSEYLDGYFDDDSDVLWTLLNNLGLTRYPDVAFDDKYVDDILEVWMDRKYYENGHGGLFPLRKNNEDQTQIELWSQMNAWVKEKFG